MQITDLLSRIGGIQSVARELGVTEAQAASGAAALTPAILGGIKKQAQGVATGTEGLGGLLGKLGGGGLLDDVLGPQPTNVNRGNDVLGQIFGSRDVSRTVAQSAASSSGLSPELLKKMLPMVAMLVTGYLAKQKMGGAAGTVSGQASSGDGLGGLLGGLPGGSAPRSGAGGGLASMLDMDGNGNPLDDILRVAGKIGR